MKSGRVAILLSVFLCFLISIFVAFALIDRGASPPVPIGELADPELAVTGFFDAVVSGDYAVAEGYVANYTGLELAKEPESEISKRLYSIIRGSYSYSLGMENGGCVVSGLSAEQIVVVNYFSAKLASERIRVRTEELYENKMRKVSNNDEIYDENGKLRESIAMELFNQATDEVISNPDDFLTSATITVELVYKNGEWKINLSDEMVSVLLGELDKI